MKIKCVHHYWKYGWICEKCGLRRADYEDNKKRMKNINKEQHGS